MSTDEFCLVLTDEMTKQVFKVWYIVIMFNFLWWLRESRKTCFMIVWIKMWDELKKSVRHLKTYTSWRKLNVDFLVFIICVFLFIYHCFVTFSYLYFFLMFQDNISSSESSIESGLFRHKSVARQNLPARLNWLTALC